MTVQAHPPPAASESPLRGLAKLLRTGHNVVPLISRLALGIVFFPHGAQKVLGWFGGYGVHGTMGFFSKLGIPGPFGALAIAAEFLGSIGLLLGAFSRVAAFGIAVNMIVAVVLVHSRVGFFMNWYGNQGGEGFEFHLLAVALALVVMIRGGGMYSADRVITRRIER